MDLNNRQEWLQWRRQGIGASEAAILHNESPYKNRYDLYIEKISEGEIEEKSNPAMQKGQELEPIIRKRWATIAALELFIESDWQPLNVDNNGKVMRASLDGAYCDCDEGILIISEFKFQGEKAHEAIKNKICPRHYWIQVQHQLLVTGAPKAYLVSYSDQLDTINYMEILPDVEFHNLHIKKCREFWKEVLAREPSEETLSFKKEIKTSTDSSMKILAKKYSDLSKKIKEDEEILEVLKKQLIEANGNADKTDFEYVTVTKAIRAGAVNYSDIPEIKALSKDYISNFRKKDTEYFLIKISK